MEARRLVLQRKPKEEESLGESGQRIPCNDWGRKMVDSGAGGH